MPDAESPVPISAALIAATNMAVSVGLFIQPLRSIQVLERLTWRPTPGLLAGIITGAIIGLSVGSVGDGVRIMIIFGLLSGMTTPPLREHKERPPHMIRRTGLIALSGIVIGAAFTGLLYIAPMVGLAGIESDPATSLAIVVITLVWSLRSGLIAVIQHVVLRCLLVISCNIPVRFVQMLEEAKDRILLRKVGPGYMFLHPIIAKYFADQYQADRSYRLYCKSRSAVKK